MILGLVIVSIIAGIFITSLGYYTPWMIVSSLLMATGAGLLSTFEVGTGHAMWIGFQAIYGFGVGAGMQQGVIAAQTVCTLDDIPTATGTLPRSIYPVERALLITESCSSYYEFLSQSWGRPFHRGWAEHLYQSPFYQSCHRCTHSRPINYPQNGGNESTKCRGFWESRGCPVRI